MRALSAPLRKQLESAVLSARRVSEGASRAAVEGLGVFAERRPEHLSDEQASLRNGLRAKWRQLGGERELLVGECAYEQWHRLLFARFLAENNLLLHPQYRAPVTLDECEELARELGEPDGWSVAARFAAEILPGIFRLDDPCVHLRLAPEGRHALETVLDSLPVEVFAADDALGWVYQFWQADKKDEVNASERKIEGADLGPVTQLFTENYMVRFLLENSLGAWWAARHPDSPLLNGFEYLRFDGEGKPAAGSFEGWPDSAAEVTVMDPCCGSGHFLVEAFSMLWQMRAEEEGCDAVDAQDATLRDNLFGLELDSRCVQIAAFAMALSAWKAGGYRELPKPAIACSGVPVSGQLGEWRALAGGLSALEEALEVLHTQFRDAPNLGSLIDPKRSTPEGRLFSVDYSTVAPALEELLSREQDPQAQVAGVTAAGVARAAELLSHEFTLVATNVPYLGVQRMPEAMADFLLERYPLSANDLATVFIERCLRLTSQTVALVTPMGWLFLRYFGDLRKSLLAGESWRIFAPLGKGAFEAITGHVVQSALLVVSHGSVDGQVAAIDATMADGAASKATTLVGDPVLFLSQSDLLGSPDTLLALEASSARPLSDFASSWQGLVTGDAARFIVRYWEVGSVEEPWKRFLTAPGTTSFYAGRESLLRWESGSGDLVKNSGAHNFNPSDVLGNAGVLVAQSSLRATLYQGEIFCTASSPVIPFDDTDVPALWMYLSSDEFARRVRQINHKIIVDPGYLIKVPFDLERWRGLAGRAYPDGLPRPWSDDPTQWLFEGRPEVSTAPLQVAVGRLLGYRWPEQGEADDLDGLADVDGIVCLPSVAGEPPASERLQQVLASAFGEGWSPAKLKELLEQAGSKKRNLAEWLRDEFFKQHCALFGNRPFIWQISDGEREGFSALVNYHRLDRKTLEKLTYTYLGQDWVERQRAGVRDEVAGAEARLAAGLELQRKLEAILSGEAPYDIFVRWKELHEQPIGWEPDLNDGVRLNIRPFVEAGVLRAPFNIHWKKDRGKNADGSERLNDIHLSLAEKLKAPTRAGHA